jgi:hypothetical protein
MAADSAGGQHKPRITLPLYVAPSTDTDLPNLIIPTMVPLACWRFEDAHFAFDSSVINPQSRDEMGDFKTLWDKTGHPPLSLFGHADPVGDDEYNKTLSGRRAMSMYGLLTRDTDVWEKLYNQPFSTDNWATNGALPLMRDTTGESASTARTDLYKKYMDAICQDADGQPFAIEKTQFLAQGSDPDGKGDYQGCSEFNPILLFSNSEAQALDADHAERNRQNQPNRRVMIFMFPPGMVIDPTGWPCPRAKEPSAGCRAQFWPDGDQRRAQGDTRRVYETDKRTFACRFYDSMAHRSPCEIVRKTLNVRLSDWRKNAIANAPYRVTLASGEQRNGKAQRIGDQEGWLVQTNVLAPSRVLIEWGEPAQNSDEQTYPYRVNMYLDIEPSDLDDDAYRRRLNNLGYPETDDLADSVRPFQRDYGLQQTGQLDDATKQALVDANDHGKTKDEMKGA